MAVEIFTQTIIQLSKHLSIDLCDLSVLSRKLTELNLKYKALASVCLKATNWNHISRQVILHMLFHARLPNSSV